MHSDIFQWIQEHDTALTALSFGSLLMFLASLALIPIILIRLPSDYFTRQSPTRVREHPVLFLIRVILQNLLGVALLLAGILMLVLPGQGLLTILLGISLIHFPRKRQLVQRLIRMRRIHRSINWIRSRYGVAPIEVPGHNPVSQNHATRGT